jgi:Tol biopolymer transport system component
VSLADVNANCAVTEPSTRPVVVPARGLVDLAFEVVCHDGPAAGRGHEIVYGSGDDATVLYSVNEDGSRQVRLFPELEASLSAPAWAPDGTRLAFYASDATIQIEVADIVAGGRVELPAEASFLTGPSLAWSPDGTRLALGGSSLSVVHVDGSGTDEIDSGFFFDAVRSPTWSPDGGRIAFVGISESSLFDEHLFPLITDLAVPGVSGPLPGCDRNDVTDVAWSPDGSRLAVTAAGHIFILNFQTGECVPITAGPWTDKSPSWSPDGTQLAFSSTRDGNAEIYVMGADGSAPIRITRNPVADVTPAWRP